MTYNESSSPVTCGEGIVVTSFSIVGLGPTIILSSNRMSEAPLPISF